MPSLERADALNRAGFYRRGLRELARLSRAAPRDPAPHAAAAQICLDQALYRQALAALGKALALAPRDLALRLRRARLLIAMGRLSGAEAELARARRLRPGDPRVEEEHALVRLRQGKSASARTEFVRGYRSFRAGRWRQAKAHFRRAGTEKGLCFALAAELLSRPLELPRARLYLCGIGIRHPWQTTAELLHALRRARTIYNNIGDPEISEFLGLFPGKVVAVAREGTAASRAARILRALPAGPSAFVTRIHPLVYRQISWELARLCRARSVPLHCFGAVSLTEMLHGLAGAGGALRGLRVFDIDCLLRRPELLDARFPAVVYCIAGARRRRALCRVLARKRTEFLLLPGAGADEDRAFPLKAAQLSRALLGADSGALLFVPAKGERALAREGAGVALCGLGARPGRETTLEALRALEDAPRVFTDITDAPTLRFLRRFCRPQRARSARALAAAAPAAVAVWGQPQACSRLARELERRAPCRTPGAVSPLASALARTQSFIGGGYGYPGAQAYHLDVALARPSAIEPGLPLVVYAEGPARWSRLFARLRRLYPAGHPVRVDEGVAFVPPDPRREIRGQR